MAEATERDKCHKQIWRSGSFHGSRCSNFAKPGSQYCGIHSPEAKERRDKRRREHYDALNEQRERRNEAFMRERHKAACFDDLLECLKQSFDELREWREESLDDLGPFLSHLQEVIVKAEGK